MKLTFPIEDDVSSSLMSQLKRAILRLSAEHQQTLVRLLQVRVVIQLNGGSCIDCLKLFYRGLHGFVQHDIADVLNVRKVLRFQVLNDS